MTGREGIVAVSTAAYDGYDFDTIFASLANLGVKWVEPAFIEGYITFKDSDLTPAYAQTLKDRMEYLGLRCATFSGHMDLGTEDAIPSFLRRLVFASVLGAKIVISNSAFPEGRDIFLKNIRQLASAAAAGGMRIGLENTGFERRTLLSRAADIPPLLNAVGTKVVGVNYDTANVITHHQGAVPASVDLVAAAARLTSLHLKDTRRLSDGSYQMCPLGDGDTDNRAALDIIRSENPALPVVLELPLRLRWINRQPVRTPERLPLDVIERSVAQSLDWLKKQQE